MKYHWKDIEGSKGLWDGLAIKIESAPSATYKLQSGGNMRIKLSNNGKPIFWAAVHHGYYGVSILHSHERMTKEEMLLPPITSKDIEEKRGLLGDEFYKAWSRYFLDKLIHSSSRIFYDGMWYMTGLRSRSDIHWDYYNLHLEDSSRQTTIYEVKKALSRPQLDYIDWGSCGSGDLIATKKRPDETDGRVKWWRKKVKEKSLPPILVWYLSCLDAFIIIDGHCRLFAAILENEPPAIIALSAGHEQHIMQDKQRQKNILESMEKAVNISVETMNTVLVQAFDDRPVITSATKSEALYNFENLWIQEVTEKLKEIGREKDIEEML